MFATLDERGEAKFVGLKVFKKGFGLIKKKELLKMFNYPILNEFINGQSRWN